MIVLYIYIIYMVYIWYIADKYMSYTRYMTCIRTILCFAVASHNNDRTMAGKSFAWRLLGMAPSLSKAATVLQTDEWRTDQRTRLYHSWIDILAAQINDLTGRSDMHFSFRRLKVSTLPCISGFSLHGWGRGVNYNNVSNNAVLKVLVS